jgi:hypothetical protein
VAWVSWRRLPPSHRYLQHLRDLRPVLVSHLHGETECPGLRGRSAAMAPMASPVATRSVVVVQVTPLFVDDHTPPPAVPTKIVPDLDTARLSTRPELGGA